MRVEWHFVSSRVRTGTQAGKRRRKRPLSGKRKSRTRRRGEGRGGEGVCARRGVAGTGQSQVVRRRCSLRDGTGAGRGRTERERRDLRVEVEEHVSVRVAQVVAD